MDLEAALLVLILSGTLLPLVAAVCLFGNRKKAARRATDVSKLAHQQSLAPGNQEIRLIEQSVPAPSLDLQKLSRAIGLSQPDPSIRPASFTQLLGSGPLGPVFQGIWRRQAVVVKCVGHSQAAAQSFGAVAALLQSIDHPHIAKVLHVEVLQGDDLARRVDGVQGAWPPTGIIGHHSSEPSTTRCTPQPPAILCTQLQPIPSLPAPPPASSTTHRPSHSILSTETSHIQIGFPFGSPPPPQPSSFRVFGAALARRSNGLTRVSMGLSSASPGFKGAPPAGYSAAAASATAPVIGGFQTAQSGAMDAGSSPQGTHNMPSGSNCSVEHRQQSFAMSPQLSSAYQSQTTASQSFEQVQGSAGGPLSMTFSPPECWTCLIMEQRLGASGTGMHALGGGLGLQDGNGGSDYGSLATLLADAEAMRVPSHARPPPLRHIANLLSIAHGVARALRYLHAEHGICHGAVRPSNVLLHVMMQPAGGKAVVPGSTLACSTTATASIHAGPGSVHQHQYEKEQQLPAPQVEEQQVAVQPAALETDATSALQTTTFNMNASSVCPTPAGMPPAVNSKAELFREAVAASFVTSTLSAPAHWTSGQPCPASYMQRNHSSSAESSDAAASAYPSSTVLTTAPSTLLAYGSAGGLTSWQDASCLGSINRSGSAVSPRRVVGAGAESAFTSEGSTILLRAPSHGHGRSSLMPQGSAMQPESLPHTSQDSLLLSPSGMSGCKLPPPAAFNTPSALYGVQGLDTSRNGLAVTAAGACGGINGPTPRPYIDSYSQLLDSNISRNDITAVQGPIATAAAVQACDEHKALQAGSGSRDSIGSGGQGMSVTFTLPDSALEQEAFAHAPLHAHGVVHAVESLSGAVAAAKPADTEQMVFAAALGECTSDEDRNALGTVHPLTNMHTDGTATSTTPSSAWLNPSHQQHQPSSKRISGSGGGSAGCGGGIIPNGQLIHVGSVLMDALSAPAAAVVASPAGSAGVWAGGAVVSPFSGSSGTLYPIAEAPTLISDAAAAAGGAEARLQRYKYTTGFSTPAPPQQVRHSQAGPVQSSTNVQTNNTMQAASPLGAPAAAAPNAAPAGTTIGEMTAPIAAPVSFAISSSAVRMRVMAQLADCGLSHVALSVCAHPGAVQGGRGAWSCAASAARSKSAVDHTAPELLLTGALHDSTDVYSFGILLWDLISGQNPYPHLNTAQVVYKVAVGGVRPAFGPAVPQQYRQLAEACLVSDPAARPGFDDIISRLECMEKIADELQSEWECKQGIYSAMSVVPYQVVSPGDIPGLHALTVAAWAAAAGVKDVTGRNARRSLSAQQRLAELLRSSQ